MANIWGTDYEVKASMGHLRDLPKSTLGVDVEDDFDPQLPAHQGQGGHHQGPEDHGGQEAKTVYLATDPDREGEAISWHLKHLLDLPDEKAQRVTFNEITKKVVQESIQHPRAIDQDLVDAQQARRMLDRHRGLSALPPAVEEDPPGPVRRPCAVGGHPAGGRAGAGDRGLRAPGVLDAGRHTCNNARAPASFTAHYYGEDGKKARA